MSEYTRFEVKPFRRFYDGQRRYIMAAAAYRSGSRLNYGDRQFDFSQKKQDVIVSEILLPDCAPDILRNRGVLWGAVEAAERMADGLLARELIVDLPQGLAPTMWWEAVRSFASTQFVQQGMIVDLAIHQPDRLGKLSFPHAHLLLTVRKVGPAGFLHIENEWREALHDPVLKKTWSQAFACEHTSNI
ncbi:MobA/MobL protein (fragment) [Rhodospirillaceae bacterium LM-1]